MMNDALHALAARHIALMSALVARQVAERERLLFPFKTKRIPDIDTLPPRIQGWLEWRWGCRSLHFALWDIGGLHT